MSEIDRKDSIEEFEKVYNSYKNGEYAFGKYETEFDLVQAFLEGKIFVLKGSNIGIYISIIMAVIFLFIIIFFSLFVDTRFFFTLVISIVVSITEIPFIVFAIIIKRRFVVIGPYGLYYRRYSKKDFFLWKDVDPKMRLKYSTLVVDITIITPNNKKIRFLHGQYKKKEFPSLVKEEMFYRLFQIYFQFGKRPPPRG